MELWQRFTVHARRAIPIAHDEAAQMQRLEIAPEHLLLGVLGLGGGLRQEPPRGSQRGPRRT